MNAPVNISQHSEQLLQRLADSLQVPRDKLAAADRSYHSVADWLGRPGSTLAAAQPQVYVQGSFRLGTTIRPLNADADYDLDLVCELSVLKSQLTQAQLKTALGVELKAYAKRQSMAEPEEGRRCWTQTYHDEAQFHLDTLPAIPDGASRRRLLETARRTTEWSETAIAITDKEHRNYRTLSTEWPHSNPKGYANWFRARHQAAFDGRRRALALEARAAVEDIPEYDVRTPLQNAIQILKHHRDVMFIDRCDDKPISIILTTLAAHAYEQEATLGRTLQGVLGRMESFITVRNGVTWIANPTDDAENFADRWVRHPERKAAFYEWLRQAQADFTAAALAASLDTAKSALAPRLRSRLTEQAFAASGGGGRAGFTSLATTARQILNPAHRRAPPWTRLDQGHVRVDTAAASRSGFRPDLLASGGGPIPKHCSLTFEASTNVPRPFQVYWQVVNTGPDAEASNCLRGGFDVGEVATGKLTRKETSLYRGAHSIECFIVKDGYLAARSGQFIVNIA
jgi:hypothetical protein